MNIGYDFDGIFHKSVNKIDKYLQRRTNEDSKNYIIFHKMIDNIINESYYNNQYIITARSINNKNYNDIKYIISKTNLDINKFNNIIFTNDNSKVEAIKDFKIEKFYDDSPIRIGEIYYAKISNQLPHLKELYFVIPEYDSWILVNDENIINIL